MSDTTHYCPQCVEFSAALLQAQAELVAAVGPSEVVVSRTDLEWALRLIENVHTVIWPNAKDVPYVEFDRLRAVLNTENQT